MTPRRLQGAEWVAGGGGALLLVSLFLPWFGGGTGELSGVGPSQLDGSYSAWTTFTVADLMLAAGALAAIALPVLGRARSALDRRLALSVVVAFCGLALAVLVMVRVLSPPEFQLVQEGRAATSVTVYRGSDPAAGLWLGLAGCAAIVASGCLALSSWQPTSRAGLMAAPAPQARR